MADPKITKTDKEYRRKQLLLVKDAKQATDALINDFTLRVQGILVHHADKQGNVPPSALRTIQNQVHRDLQKLILGSPQNGALQPFSIHQDRVTPNSQFARLLWQYLIEAIKFSVVHESIDKRKTIPAEILDNLKKITPSPSTLDPLLTKYESPTEWLDPKQRRLNDRLFNIFGEEQRRIDRFLETNILHRNVTQTEATDEDGDTENQMDITPISATAIAQKFAGANLFYELSRLVFNEIYGATVRSTWISATLDPSTAFYQPHVSPSHEVEDECDEEEANGPYEISDPTHLPGFHPNCATPGQLVGTTKGDVCIEDVQVGDLVLTHKGQYRRVLSIMNREYTGIVYKVRTTRGTFDLTPEHPVLLKNEWIDTKNLKFGDQILYASVGAQRNFFVGISKHLPTKLTQSIISFVVFFYNLFMFVPPAIAFNIHLIFNNCKVECKLFYRIFPLKQNTGTGKGFFNRFLYDGRPNPQASFSIGVQRRQQSRIGKFLSFRDFNRYFGTLRIAWTTFCNKPLQRLGHFLASLNTSFATISYPLCFNGLTLSSHWNIGQLQKFAQSPEGNTKPFTNLRRSKQLSGIPIVKNIFNTVAKLGLNAKDMPIKHSMSTTYEMGGAWRNALLSTKRTNKTLFHDTSNCVIQPQQYYSHIVSVQQIQYSGKVYNLHVDEDNSYTLGGAAVHNCACNVEYLSSGNFNWNTFATSNDNSTAVGLWFLLYGASTLANKLLAPKVHEPQVQQPQ